MAGQDLRGRDLSQVSGLRPADLAGADLTDATLPDHLSFDEPLRQVEEISKNARKVFIGLLLGCVYAMLTIGTTTDLALIVNTASSPLPIINTPVPIAGFYIVGALVLAAVYAYFHFYLQRLWRTLGSLPAVFPDGTALDDRAYPWLLTGFARRHTPHLRCQPRPLARLEVEAALLLGWGPVPVTLAAMWLRYLPARDLVGIVCLGALVTLAAGFGSLTYRLAVATLRGQISTATASRQQIVRLYAHNLPVLTALAVGTLVGVVIWSARVDPPPHRWEEVVDPPAAAGRETTVPETTPLVPWLLERMAWGTYAHLREAKVSTSAQAGSEAAIGRGNAIDLRGRNLAFADVRQAYLAGTDLRGAVLQEAILIRAVLQEANLQEANLQEANLNQANLQKADLSEANLRFAELGFANLRDAYLYGADLEGAALPNADLRQAELAYANLRLTDLASANLLRANFKAANLVEAKLFGSELQEALLGGANLQKAELGYANLHEADLSFATLQDTNLRNTELRGADLGGARGLTQPQLDGACGDDATRLPGRPVEVWEKLGGFWIRPCPDDEAAGRVPEADESSPTASTSSGPAAELAGGP